ncbi:MAG: carbohydrate kinase family protein [Candidatus Thorarchaeota archaeon]|nr:carbohydrate kinase family protein [Candidatus Thorarchaeota archaeon]
MELVVIGHLSRDCIVTPEARIETLGGGPAYAMIAPAVGAMGAGIVSCIGSDFEDVYLEILQNSGLDLSGLHVKGMKSTRFINEYDFEGRSQCVEAIAEPVVPEDILPQHLGASIYHFSPLTAADIDDGCYSKARMGGPLVSLDAQGYLRDIVDGCVVEKEWKNPSRILSLVDVVKFNELELSAAFDAQSELSAVTEILELGPRIVLVTRSRKGSTVYTRNTQMDIPLVLGSESADSTGSGDVYAMGFLLEYIRTGDVKRAGLFGATCSSFNAQTHGPIGMPSRKQVEDRMKVYL